MQKISPKRKVFLTLFLAYCFIFLMGSKQQSTTSTEVYDYYLQHLKNLDITVKNMETMVDKVDQQTMKTQFKTARHFYKKIEFIITYHFAETANILNAPNLLETNISTPNEPEFPSGFQVLEEEVFTTEYYNKNNVKNNIHELRFGVDRLITSAEELSLTESGILDALKLNLYRLITKGISGFDSPVAQLGIEEAKSTIESTNHVLGYFINNQSMVEIAKKNLVYLENYTGDFNGFNRAEFIADFINPLCNAMYDYQIKMDIVFAKNPPKAVAANVPNLFSKNAFDLTFFSPSNTLPINEQTIRLGKKLFNDKRLSIYQKRSCATCHNPNLAFTDGYKKNESLLNGEKLMRNTPTLINSALQPVQFYDSRVSFIEDQAHEVISNQEEMGGVFEQIILDLKKDKIYQKDFKNIFKDKQINERNIKSALAVYVRSLVALDSKFDKYMRGNKSAMNKNEIEGFNIFMGKAKCGTCHYLPLFNGSVPPLFDKMESEVLGVPNSKDTLLAKLDNDSGKYKVYQIPHQLFSFKTTSLRNCEVTAPYMHNGVYETLEQVLGFYNRGGGAGLGIELNNQTLPTDKLELSETEKNNIIQFLHSLTDTSSFKINY